MKQLDPVTNGTSDTVRPSGLMPFDEAIAMFEECAIQSHVAVMNAHASIERCRALLAQIHQAAG